MIAFTILDKEYKIDKLTIDHYYQIQDIHFMDDIDSQIKFISTLSSCPDKLLKKLNKIEFGVIWNEVKNSLIYSGKETEFHQSFNLNGVDYAIMHFDEMTLGEFVDMDILANDPMREKKLHQMMSILYRPITETDLKGKKKYKIEEYDHDSSFDRADEFLQLELKIVKGAISFFLSIPKACFDLMLDSLKEKKSLTEEEIATLEMIQTLSESQETGSTLSSSSLAKIHQDSFQLQRSLLMQHLTTQLTLKTNESEKN